MRSYVLQLLVALDQLGNALFSGFADETISSRLYRLDRDGRRAGRWLRPVVDRLFFMQTRHCQTAYELERKRAQLPPEFRL